MLTKKNTEFVFLEKEKWKLSQKGIDLILESEGLELNAYHPKGDVPTIGYGTTVYPDGKRVKLGDKITKEQALEFFMHDSKWVINSIKRLVTVPLTQGQIDALGSFIYNLGETNFSNSTLLKKINRKDYLGAALEFPRWNKRKGVVLNGLTKRRNKERNLWLVKGE